LLFLIFGGNETTRNPIIGGPLTLNKHPDEYRKLVENFMLIGSMVPEIIRWQAYIRPTAIEDTEHVSKEAKVRYQRREKCLSNRARHGCCGIK
jgi:cytochrome P450